MQSREVRVATAPDGLPRSSDLEIVSVEVPDPGPGEVLVRNRYFSVFAALRTLLAGVQGAPLGALRPGDTLVGPAIGEVLWAPGGSGLRPGDLVQHMLGWREYAAVPVGGTGPVVLPDPIAHFAQGTVAYGALTRGVRVERGDTVFVSGGAGSVGSMAGQIARLLGAGRVIGSTGSAWKAERMTAELGYDAVVARGATPDEGIDVLIDCVGGADLRAAISAANKGARFALVGALSGQLDPQRDGLTAPTEIDTFAVILKQITMVGYSPVGDAELRSEWLERFAGWLKDGVIAYPHVRVEGIDPGSPYVGGVAGRASPRRGGRGVGVGGGAVRIGDVAAAAGTTSRAVRFYEANGLIAPPPRTGSGQRVYGPREVARLRVIRTLLGLGLTVADVRDCADRLDLIEGDRLPPHGGPGACAKPTGIVTRRIAAMDAEIARLTALRDELAAKTGIQH